MFRVRHSHKGRTLVSSPLPVYVVQAPMGGPDGARASEGRSTYFHKSCHMLSSRFVSMESGNEISGNVLQYYSPIFVLKYHIFSLSLVLMCRWSVFSHWSLDKKCGMS